MAELRLPKEAYMPGGITIRHAVTYDEALQEYTRLRRAAQKRLMRFEGTQFVESQAYQLNVHNYPQPSKISSAEQLSAKLGDLRRFLTSPAGSIAGQRKMQADSIKQLHEHGFEFVNERNYQSFVRFMDSARIAAGGKFHASDQVAEMFDVAERKNIPPEQLLKDFEYWQDNLGELDKSKTISKAPSAAKYKQNIQKRKRRAKRRGRK